MPIILCLDPGTAHTGIAISHEGVLAEPLATVYESKINKLVEKLLPFITENHPELIVIGVPNHGPLVEYATELKSQIESKYSGEVVLFSEDLSSRSARSLLKETGKTLIRRKHDEHQTAAAIILEDYLDSL